MGLETAKTLIDSGAHVIITGRNKNNVDKTGGELGPNATVLCSDISSLEDTKNLVSEISNKFGAIDALFIFAAVAEYEPVSQVTESSFDKQFSINAKGAFFAMQGFCVHYQGWRIDHRYNSDTFHGISRNVGLYGDEGRCACIRPSICSGAS